MVHLRFIWRQLLALVIILAMGNAYAYEYRCNIRLAIPPAHAGGDHGHPAGHGHEGRPGQGSPGHHEHKTSPHSDHDPSEEGCCKEKTTDFFAGLHVQDTPDFKISPAPFIAFLPPWLGDLLAAVAGDAHAPAGFPPERGLPPKIPDLRIYLCSLTI